MRFVREVIGGHLPTTDRPPRPMTRIYLLPPRLLAAFRAWLQGLSSRQAVDRYLSERRAAGASSRTLIGRVKRQLVAFAGSRSRADLAAILGAARPTDKRSAKAAAAAIESLRGMPRPEPLIEDAVALWLGGTRQGQQGPRRRQRLGQRAAAGRRARRADGSHRRDPRRLQQPAARHPAGPANRCWGPVIRWSSTPFLASTDGPGRDAVPRQQPGCAAPTDWHNGALVLALARHYAG